MRNFAIAIIAACGLTLAACDFNGGVEQGRCVAFNPEAKTVTLVVDTTLDQHNPHYSGDIHTFKLPVEPIDMGPEPIAGGRLMLEIDKNMLLYYDPESRSIKEMPVEYVDIQKDIAPRDARLKGKSFPVIDREKRTITVYSPRLASLVTFRVPEAALSLPAYTWEDGDEVRVAFRNDNREQAIRLMNVTRTSIFTR